MAQLTAVEFVLQYLQNVKPNEFCSIEKIKELLEQAKEMEKEQHGNTWDEAIDTHERRGHVIARSLVDFDDYFNETYGRA
jgi:site-specific DNA-cytosine methylase